MKRSLRTQMFIQYATIVVLCMLVIPTAISWFLDRQFRMFAEDRLREERQEVVLLMQSLYARTNSWDEVRVKGLLGETMRWPIAAINVYDADGQLVKSLSRAMRRRPNGKDAQHMPLKRAANSQCRMIDEPIIVSGENVGHVSFSCLPFKDSREGEFLRQFNFHLYLSVCFMLILSAVVAFFMADRISRPVLNAAKRAHLISGGKYKIDDETSSDITEIETLIESMNRLGQALEMQEELRKRLMSDIAHELRNPVTIVKSHLEAFEDGVWEPTSERLRLTVSEIDRLSKLISEVGNLYAIEGTENSLSISAANISEELERIVLSFSHLFANKSVSLTADIEGGAEAAVDIGKLRQAVTNLLSNALRYTDEGGKVLLSLKTLPDYLEIIVRDNGIGIAKSDLPNIFERFYRADKSRTRASGGMGIGLAITKAIAEAHGGTIRVESTEGEGSTFIITLPVRRDIQTI